MADPPGSDVVVQAEGVAVRRAGRVLARGLDVTLRPGEALHLSGANGSGKTSVLRVLAGLLPPDAGALRRPPACAFVPERTALLEGASARSWLLAMRRLRGAAPEDWDALAAADALPDGTLDRPAGALSKGTLQRVALLEAFAAPVPLLVLDEPASGLDPAARERFLGRVAARRAEGCAVVVAEPVDADALVLDGARRLRLADGVLREAGSPSPRPRRRIVTVDPGGDRHEQVVAADASDAALRAALDAGHHVAEVADA
jgi:heme exporter protein A